MTNEPKILHTLNPDTDGWAVRGALTERRGADGVPRLYGAAGECGPLGAHNCASTANWPTVVHTHQCPGTLFSIALDGSGFRVEHAFTQLDGNGRNADGYHPYGTLALGRDRRLYGVTQFGGLAGSGLPGDPLNGYGVLFAYDPDTGAFEVLHHFGTAFAARDGLYPMGALAVDGHGNVYGTAKGGGQGNAGAVWKWSPSGAFSFAGLPGETYGGVTLAGGLLHGTSWSGGAGGRGVYFIVDPSTLEVVAIDSFPAFAQPEHGDDNTPIQEPTAVSDGSVIVARELGGAASSGVIVRLDPTTGVCVLREAPGISLDAEPRFSNAAGSMLNGRLVEARDGLLYGCAQYGGAAGTGGIYRVSRDGTLYQLVWSWPDGAYPYGGPTLGSDGALYGVTFGTGQIWRLVPPPL